MQGRKNTTLTRLRVTTALTGVLCLASFPAGALPVGGQVAAGQATIATSGATLTVKQSSDHAVLNWQSFDIGSGERVNFQQPSSSSVALNRVTGSQNPSQILGTLTANGTVMLINPNGVVFGRNSEVNVGSLVVSSSNIDDDRFMKGDYTFNHPGNPNAAIENDGSITAADAGLVAMVAPSVVNKGVITARVGKVAMASGDTATVDLYGDGLISIEVKGPIGKQLVQNSGIIEANGGDVLMTTAAAQQVVNSAINMDGVIQAESIGKHNGQIILYAEGSNAVKNNVAANKGQKQGSSTVLVSGLLDASGYGQGQKGGTISVLGDNVGILNGGLLDASGDAGGGTIKIGGDFHGAGMTPTALNTYVDGNSLILANANSSGNGGNVAVWSDGTTQFYGNILAEGGTNSGNGGFVETSGHGTLDAQGYVDLTAPNGNKGTYLLDPATIEIYGNVTPAFNATDSSISLSSNLKLWLDTSDTANVNLTYNSLGTTATGTSGANTITVSANTSLVAGARIRLGGAGSVTAASTLGADTYTISSISGTTITLTSNLTTNYSGSTIYQGYVSQLTDKSGNSNNVTQGTAANMPLWVSNGQNGIGVASFNGSNWLTSPSSFAFGTGAFSVGGLFDITTTSTFSIVASLNGSNTNGGVIFANPSSNGIGWYANGTHITSALPSANTWYSFALVGDGGGSGSRHGTLYVNSAQVGTSLFDYNISSGQFVFGGNQSSFAETMHGFIPEVYIYNTNLSTNAQALVSQYQSAKWGFALTPPGTGATEVAQATASDGYSVFSDAYLVRLSSSANIALSATGAVTLDLQGDNMSLASGKSLSITAGTSTAASNITFISPGTITTNNAGITLTPGSSGSIVLNSSSAVTLASNGGTISLAGPVSLSSGLTVNSGGAAVSFSSTVDGAQNLTVNSGSGGTTFSSTIGATTPLSSLSLTGDTLTLSGNIKGTGTLTIAPSTASTNLHINDSTSSGLYLTSAEQGYIQNDWASVVLGASGDTGAMTVGATTWVNPLSLIANASGSITVSGAQSGSGAFSFTGPTTLSGNVTSTGSGTGVTFNNAVTLGASDTVTTTNGAVSFASTVDGTSSGAQSLTVSDGTGGTTFSGKIGGTTPLSSLSLTGDTLTLSDKVYGTGTLTIAPSTASTNLHINDGTSSGLYLTSAEQGYIQSDWAGVTLGSSSGSGTMTLGTTTWGNPLTLTNGSGAITFAGSQTLGSNENFSATTTSGNINTSNSGILTTAGTGTITMNSGGDINLSNFGLTTANAAVSLTATGNAYLNAVNSGTGSLTVSANDVYLYGGGLPSPGNLVGYYNFNEGSGATATDDSGNGSNGTISNATYSSTVPAGSGYSLSFNGTNSVVSASSLNDPSGGANRTMTGWVYLNALPSSGEATFFGYGNAGTTNGVYELFTDSGHHLLFSQWGNSVTGAGTLNTGQWYFVAVTNSGNSVTLYLNGTQNGSGTNTINTVTSSSNLFVGYIDPTRVLNGLVDDVRIYNTLLSTQDITNLYNNAGATWQVGTTSITASHNINLNLDGSTLNVSSGHNLTLSAANALNGASPSTLGGSSASGNITLTANSLSLTTVPTLQTTGIVTLKPYTASTTVGVAGGAGTLGVTSSMLNAISGASEVDVGATGDTGLLTANAYTWGEAAKLYDGSGNIAINGAQSMGANSFLADTASGNITIGASGSVTSTAAGNAIVLASGGNFTNSNGSGALSASGGRWIIYSTTALSDTKGGLSESQDIYSQTYGSLPPSSIVPATYNGTQNTWVYSTGLITLTALGQTVTYGTAPNSSAVLNTTYSFSCSTGCSSAVITGGPSFGFTGGAGTSTSGNYNVGSWTITPSAATDNNNFAINYATGTLTVNSKTLTDTGFAASNKTYDGLTTASISANGSLSGIVSGDVVSLNSGGASATFDNKNVGTTHTVTAAGYALAGADAGDYTLTQPTANPVTISARGLTVTATNKSKTYGGTDPALTYTYSGLAAGDVSASFTGALNRDAGENVGVYNINQHTLAATGNYTIGTFNTGTFTINAAALAVTADNKSMNFGTAVPPLTYTYTGLVNGDVSASFTGALATTGTSRSTAGAYPITQNTLAATGNYTIGSFTNGTLTISGGALSGSVENEMNQPPAGGEGSGGAVGCEALKKVTRQSALKKQFLYCNH